MPADMEVASSTPANENAELITLRQTIKEINAKAAERKSRVEALEAELTAANEKIAQSDNKYRTTFVDLPLTKLADQVSPIPDVFLSEFRKQWKVEADDNGGLILKTLEGAPVVENGKPWPVTPNGLWRLCTGGAGSYAKTPESRKMAHLMRWLGPSGGGAVGGGSTGEPGLPEPATKQPLARATMPNLGLR